MTDPRIDYVAHAAFCPRCPIKITTADEYDFCIEGRELVDAASIESACRGCDGRGFHEGEINTGAFVREDCSECQGRGVVRR